MMNRYAVMGNPIAHSLSPVIHQCFAEQTGRTLTYEKRLIDLPQFEQQVSEFFQQGGKGLNITLPFKQRAFAMSAHQTPRCAKAGAANTLWMEAGQLHADNTDGVGLLRDLHRHVNSMAGKTILLLGAGGAARGVLGELLAAHPAKLILANRSQEKAMLIQKDFADIHPCALADLSQHAAEIRFDVVINATSAGLDDHGFVLPDAVMSTHPFCYDLAYRSTGTTPFVTWARTLGCVAVDGLGMLVEQAAEAFLIWHGVLPETLPVLHQFVASRKKGMNGRR